MEFKNKVIAYCKERNANFLDFEKYVSLIEEHNKNINLTGFSGESLWEEGILNSLLYMNSSTKDKSEIKILDIGSGVGFPAIPYALLRENNSIDIFESIQKRVDFLNLVKQELTLDKVNIYKQRAEEFSQKNIYDVVVARAVGSVKTMLMAAFHLVTLKGEMVLIKGPKYKQEILEAQEILSKLKVEVIVDKFILNAKENFLVRIKKLRSCPKEFPYSWKDIKKQS